MPDAAMIEEAVQFGEGGRLCGVLVSPASTTSDLPGLPVFVFLNSGFLHRVGPHGLYVRLTRELAGMGFHALRIDMSGKGDSPPRSGLSGRESEAADYADIVQGLEARLGSVRLVLAGLCSGADEATRLAPADQRIVGLLLLDPMCFPDGTFRIRGFAMKYLHPARYLGWLRWRLAGSGAHVAKAKVPIDPLSIRDAPTLEDLRRAFNAIRTRQGSVISVFTRWATRYYNREGQLDHVLGVENYKEFCTELFYRDAEHTYTLDVKRRQLIDTIVRWARKFIPAPPGSGRAD